MKNFNSRFLLLIGAILLTLGLLLPWVRIEPLPVRQANLEHLADLINHDKLPSSARDLLTHYGLSPGIKGKDILHVLSGGEFASNYEQLYMRQHVFSWDYIRFSTPPLLKITIIFLGVLCLTAWITFIFTLKVAVAEPDSYENQQYTSVGFVEPELQERSSMRWSVLLSVVSFLTLCLFVWYLPFLDSLGHHGNWSMSLLDILVGAKVTFVPCILVPIGLFLLILFGLND